MLYFLFFCCIFSFDISHADIATYKDGYSDPFTGVTYQGTKDATLEAVGIAWVGSTADQNYGARDYLAADRNVQFGFYGPLRTLIFFDINSITNRYDQINSVTFRFYPSLVFFSGGIMSNTISVYELSDANNGWIEGNEFESDIEEDPDIGMVTWNNKIEGIESWAGSIGASSPGIDFLTPVLVSSIFDGNTLTNAPYDFVITGQAADDLVHRWLTNSDGGIILVAGNDTYHSNSTIIRFWSSESTNINYRPELIIDFTPALEPVRIAGSTPIYYSSLQTAYDDANDGDVIQAKVEIFSEEIYIDDLSDKSVILQGGYNNNFSEITGMTSISGNVIVNNGRISMENILLQ